MANIVIDNGTHSLKYGVAGGEARVVPNCVVRTADKRFHPGTDVQDRGRMGNLSSVSGISFIRPQSHGQCFQWNLEHDIWDDAFVSNGDDSGSGDYLKDANLLYLGCVVTLPKFANMVDQVVFEEYGVGSYVRSSTAGVIPWLGAVGDEDAQKEINGKTLDDIDEDQKRSTRPKEKSKSGSKVKKEAVLMSALDSISGEEETRFHSFQLVIDCGFDATWVVPMIHGIPYQRAVRKLPVGGRMLNGYLREVISFRHYNVVEEPVLVDAIKRTTCYVAEDYDATLERLTRLRKRPSALLASDMSVNYLLPDNKGDFYGGPTTKKSVSGFEGEDAQSILLTDERFLIPELLFHPQLAGVHKAGLIATIKESLEAVPALLRPLLAHNVVCVGGTANLEGLSERIGKDLDQEVSAEARVRMCPWRHGDKGLAGFEAGGAFFSKGGFEQVKMTREEYYEFGVEYAQDKFR